MPREKGSLDWKLERIPTRTYQIQLVVTALKTFYYCLFWNGWQLLGWEKLKC